MLGSAEQEFRRKEEEMKRQMEAEQEEFRLKMEAEKAELAKLVAAKENEEEGKAAELERQRIEQERRARELEE